MANDHKIGMVLEGGGMRGLYTAGVLDVTMEHGLHGVMPSGRPYIDVICGTSAGATFGINFASKQKGRVLRYNKRFAGDKRYISLRSLLLTGDMVNKDFAYDTLPNDLDPFDYETFRNSPIEFYATVTNVASGCPEYMRITECKAQMDIIRASASLPFLSRKVRIGDSLYLDGGIADNIPLAKAEEAGCDRFIVILTHPYGYKRGEDLTKIGRIYYPFEKGLHTAFERRNDIYNACLKRIEEMERDGRAFVFRPSAEVKIGRLEKNPERIQAMYDLGMEDANARWDELTQFLGISKL